jgi:hypothetical protein
MDFDKMKKIWNKQSDSADFKAIRQEKIESVLKRKSRDFSSVFRKDIYISAAILITTAIIMVGLIIFFHQSFVLIVLASLILLMMAYGGYDLRLQMQKMNETDVNAISVRESLARKIELARQFAARGRLSAAILAPIAFTSLFFIYRIGKYGSANLKGLELYVFIILLIIVTVLSYLTGGLKYKKYAEALRHTLENIGNESGDKVPAKRGNITSIVMAIIFLLAISMYIIAMAMK